MVRESGKDRVVCVTGASGFIGSLVVKVLLERGYTVNATVRDPDDHKKTGHLLTLEGAKERLRLFKADLLEEGSFDASIAGCEGVFHCAGPVNFNVKEPQADVLDPLVKGTLNVLASCKGVSSVKRVVFTSTLGNMVFCGKPRTPEAVVDETWFSKPEYCGEYPNMKWYLTAKVLAEEEAWKFAKENDIDLITINPGMVIGTMLPPNLNESVAMIYYLISGSTEVYPNVSLPWVHNNDVAEAHVRAFEIPSAEGRYCLAESVVHHSELVRLLRDLYPSVKLPAKCADDGPLEQTYIVSKAKFESLGVKYTPLKVALKDTVENFKEKNFPIAFRMED